MKGYTEKEFCNKKALKRVFVLCLSYQRWKSSLSQLLALRERGKFSTYKMGMQVSYRFHSKIQKENHL